MITALIAAASLNASAVGFPKPEEPLFAGLGQHHRKVTTRSALGQKYFDQGLNFVFGFNHDESIRSFEEAVKQDPRCPMAYWGIAMANGPHINNPYVDPAHAKAAWIAIKKAETLAANATPAERALILAAKTRYADPQPEDRSMLDRAYANAMRKVWKQFPRDADVGAMFAEAMMDLRPWDLWKADGSPQPGTVEIVATLRAALKVDKMNPLANHLYIHAVEASPHPEEAASAADRLRFMQPGLGHMVHMPSHTYVRTGRWQDSIEANERSIKTDDAYRARRPRQGFYRIYMAHNHHMLGFSAMMTGQSAKAIHAIDTMVAGMPAAWLKENAPFVDGFVSMPIEVRKRFGKWDEVLAMPEPAEWFPISRAMRHASRAVAYAAKGRIDEAVMEQALFDEARKKVGPNATFGNNLAATILDVAQHLQNGEILVAQGREAEAIAELQRAVRAEDALRYDEPPDWILPARHTLGAYLVSRHKYADAVKVYQADLKRWPNNGWSLYGLSEALEGAGKAKEAAAARKQFGQVWAKADMSISSSCMCLPGK